MAQDKTANLTPLLLNDEMLDLVTGGLSRAGASIESIEAAGPSPPLAIDAASDSDATAAADALGTPQSGGASTLYDIQDFMAQFQTLAQECRNAAREAREAELRTQVDALRAAADEIKNAAQQRFEAALVSGAMQIAGGAMVSGSGLQARGEHPPSEGLLAGADRLADGPAMGLPASISGSVIRTAGRKDS
ncbi:type III secretion system translocon subunit SctB [Roseomonas marmotae]|uniref:Type III secretion system translocon subunit SctB n=1 Tax=Roseomonas marmotae TaxID=2768161 RepID=A0ABS3K8E7_9PROT|nr:type III secretion system translocon subunit SctB [Roseomonas marmotae]MBO1073734.1 type III secretion system translocon subunit SctB [Roseomonas marmotae]QTI78632.1 type III secretion system translocon subunit SctB [Roseomonas marmotae]